MAPNVGGSGSWVYLNSLLVSSGPFRILPSKNSSNKKYLVSKGSFRSVRSAVWCYCALSMLPSWHIPRRHTIDIKILWTNRARLNLNLLNIEPNPEKNESPVSIFFSENSEKLLYYGVTPNVTQVAYTKPCLNHSTLPLKFRWLFESFPPETLPKSFRVSTEIPLAL